MSLLYISALIFTGLAAFFAGTVVVNAIGPATDNSTVLDIPAIDQPGDEIKPNVAYVLQGPSLQPRDAPLDFIPSFVGMSENGFKVIGNESWYLDVDINVPGWLYICEYFPEYEGWSGRWIAYKWHLAQSGCWRLGPFTAGDNEPEGQHIYRLWFYSDGHWVGEEDQNSPRGKLVYWTYAKGQSTQKSGEQAVSRLPVAPATGSQLFDWLHRLVNLPILISLALLLLILLGLYIFRRYVKWGRNEVMPPAQVGLQRISVQFSSAAVSAKIVLPNGMELVLDSDRIFGRADFARVLDVDELGLISRRHFEVRVRNKQFYIEDLGSANGTRLNGADISGKGPVSLNHDDAIELAGIISLKFYCPLIL